MNTNNTITVDHLRANFEEFGERNGIEHRGYFEHPGQTTLIPGWYLEKSLDKKKFRVVAVPSNLMEPVSYPLGGDYETPFDLFHKMDIAMQTLDQGGHS
jgi:hypothetical protein